jgi:tRNA (cytosine49-C5)-methyltransferase
MRSSVRVLPQDFLSRLKKMIPSQKYDSAANTFSDTKPATFRVNSLKASRDTVKEKLEHENFRLDAVSWYPEAFILREGRLKDLEKTELYQNGEIYVQSLSSMIPPIVLEPKPGETVLDLTAAPGSKTTQMAVLMRGEGKIVACESNEIRFEKLKSNIHLQGVTNVDLILGYGESIGKKFPEHFDKVLLDAPCSAEGRFHIRTSSSYRYWNHKVVQNNAKLQKKLLASAIVALKPSGVLVYSTCTFSPEENEEVINDALTQFPDLELEPVSIKLTNQMSGLITWEGRGFNPSVRKSVRILPTETMEAFFVAKIRKKA